MYSKKRYCHNMLKKAQNQRKIMKILKIKSKSLIFVDVLLEIEKIKKSSKIKNKYSKYICLNIIRFAQKAQN